MEITYADEKLANERQATLDKVVEEVKPITNVNGTKVVSFEEQRDLARTVMEKKGAMKAREYNDDGTVKKTKFFSAAINVGAFFDNRYRVNKKKLEIVTAQTHEGWWAIEEQSSGRVPFKNLTAYVFERKDDKLQYVEMVKVTDEEFIRDFTHKLSQEAMAEILPLLPSGDTTTEDKLPI